jgi:hypothetical protein
MWLRLLAVCFVLWIIWLTYSKIPRDTKSSLADPFPAPNRMYDNQYEIFRDLEPDDQTRENPWVGFLQEDVRQNRNGPIGDFKGTDSSSGNARLYYFDKIQDVNIQSQISSNEPQVVFINSKTTQETRLGPGTYDFPPDVRVMKVLAPWTSS